MKYLPLAAALAFFLASSAFAADPSSMPWAVGQTWTNSIGMKFAYIPTGQFLMGSPATEEGRRDNETQHHVKLTKPFLMGVFMVTQAQWKAVAPSNPSHFHGDDNLPADTVTWNEATAFCRALSQKDGRTYRLPTEAEWEYACRAGTTTAYNTGPSPDALKDAGWYQGNSGGKTHPVGQKKPNAWGLYDMHGDLWQWCSDRFADYPPGDATDPRGPDHGSLRVIRGGSFDNLPPLCRSASRGSNSPGHQLIYFAARVVLDIP